MRHLMSPAPQIRTRNVSGRLSHDPWGIIGKEMIESIVVAAAREIGSETMTLRAGFGRIRLYLSQVAAPKFILFSPGACANWGTIVK